MFFIADTIFNNNKFVQTEVIVILGWIFHSLNKTAVINGGRYFAHFPVIYTLLQPSAIYYPPYESFKNSEIKLDLSLNLFATSKTAQ